MRTLQPLMMGETHDVLFTPGAPGGFILQLRAGPVTVLREQPIRVVPKR